LTLLDLENWKTTSIHAPIQFKVPFKPPFYNYIDYLDAWNNFLFLREGTHTWFVKYPKCAIRLPRRFYHWWTAYSTTLDHLTEE
jgi:hypothetical protein